jgi:hypothetical protein
MTENDLTSAPTLFFLMAQYGGRTVVPLALLRKCLRGDLQLAIVRIETSQKSARGVHLVDLANYIDARRAAALKERDQLCGLDP